MAESFKIKNAREEILKKAIEISKKHSGGESFFDALDEEIVKNSSQSLYEALFEMIPKNRFLVLSGGFGKKIAEEIDKGILPCKNYFLFEGGIRSGKAPTLIKKSFNGKEEKLGVFLDDSIYGGATYYALRDWFKGKLVSARIIYDGCPKRKTYIRSIFRYYDHFKAKPNFSF